jgi:hypothetical protein
MRARRAYVKGYVRAVTLLVALLVAGSFSAHAWNYRYDSAYDVGIWTNNGADRFRYWYGVTAWEQCASYGGWQMLGYYGWSPVSRGDSNPANFIGNGAYRNLANGWLFAYASSGDYSAWQRAADGRVRFSYAYNSGQWNDVYTATNTWAVLGAAGMSSKFIGDGVYRNVGNGWFFGYYAGGDAGYWKRAADGSMRLAYSYSAGQWNDVYTPTNSWAVVGTGGMGPGFIGNGAYWNVGNGWLFGYSVGGDYSGWKIASSGQTRFSYSFGTGLWWDYTVNGWGRLGLGGMNALFLGDGQWHQFGTNELFSYDGSFYYWATGANVCYAYDYSGQQWWKRSGSTPTWQVLDSGYQNVDVRYIGSSRYVESYLRADPGTSSQVVGGKDIVYDVWQPSATSYNWGSEVTSWAIYRPGSDNRWSGGPLNVVWCQRTDWNIGIAEYTIDDVIVFEQVMGADSHNNYTPGIGFGKMVDWLGIVRDYYGKQINNVAFAAHGYTDGSGIELGEWITTSNYYATTNYNNFIRWGSFMAAGGQILSYHCDIAQGTGATMLNDIATWTHCAVFAHSSTVDVYSSSVDGSKPQPDDNVWNHNYKNVYFGPDFDYSSTGFWNPQRLFLSGY